MTEVIPSLATATMESTSILHGNNRLKSPTSPAASDKLASVSRYAAALLIALQFIGHSDVNNRPMLNRQLTRRCRRRLSVGRRRSLTKTNVSGPGDFNSNFW